MASVQSVEKFFANNKVTSYQVGAIDSATDIAWVDMADYEGIAVIATAAALTGVGITAFSLIANSDSAGGGTDATVVSHGVAVAPDAVGDMLVLECTAEQIREVETSATGQLRYLSAKATAAAPASSVVGDRATRSPIWALPDVAGDPGSGVRRE